MDLTQVQTLWKFEELKQRISQLEMEVKKLKMKGDKKIEGLG
jgi:uncharacterized small protein (DUF1192 family)